MSLKNREEGFDNLEKRFRCRRVSSLLLEHKINPSLFKRLQYTAATYISKCLPDNEFIVSEKKLLKTLEELQDAVANITPNGMVVPKRHTILEYNLLASAFSAIIESLDINDLISSWHIPLNLRVKYSQVNQANLERHHPTEHIPSDSWAGESSESVTVHIPIFGDVENNHVSFYEPPDTFEEHWLKPRPSYIDGEEIAKKYRKIDFIPKKGRLLLADFAGLHASTRLPHAGPRISIDTTFVLRRPGDDRPAEKIHPWRENERASQDTLQSLGTEKLFYFPDTNDQFVDSEGGFKHPTNLQVLELK